MASGPFLYLVVSTNLWKTSVEAFLTATGLVAIAEIGDKTQLLAVILATRFKRPVPIILGILGATLANHAMAALAGSLLAGWLQGRVFQLIVGAAFIAMAVWALIPDKADDDDGAARAASGVFLTTLITFFLVEMGDKTQVATIALGARYHDVLMVTMGTTLGMMLTNVPAVLLGDRATKIVPLQWVRFGAAVVFTALGVWTIIQAL